MAENGPESESAQPSAPPVENGLSNHVNGSARSHDERKSDKKHSSSSSHRDKDRDRDKDRHRDDKHRSSGSSSKHSSSKDKDRSEHRSSSSKHSSSSSSKDRDKDRSKDKHRDDKERHRSDKDRKDRHKDSSGSDRDKHRSSSSSKHGSSGSSRPKEEKPKMTVKSETQETKPANDYRMTERLDSPKASPHIKKEMASPVKQSMSDDDMVGRRDSSDDVKKPLKKRPVQSEDSDDEALYEKAKKKVKQEDSDDEYLAKKAKVKTEAKAKKRPSEGGAGDSKAKKAKTESPTTPSKKAKKEKEENEVWKWWEEEKKDDGKKWNFLEHKGPLFAPAYEPLPSDVRFFYDGKVMKLSQDAEEVAGFYGKMLEHDYTTKDVFNTNFFKDWRKVMTAKEREIITDLRKCNFKEIHAHFTRVSEEKKALPKEEKKKIKEQNEAIVAEYGFCTMDGHKEKIGNFRIEPPGLFRGRGEHPKQGKLKTRVQPEDVIINCAKNSKIPQPPPGHKWKEVRHDNSVTWLCSWNENIQGAVKYIMLNASSRLKGEKDWQKYETARKLKKVVGKIRANYFEDLKSKEMRVRQRAVAMYFIDKLALRAGNEKDEGESADTVGCCSLRVEHIKLHDSWRGKENVVEFDFLGKDSIRYQNSVPVDKRVYKNVRLFMDGKNGNDDLFDRLNTSILNQHLQSLMEGLTAKVFRTYNASKTLQEQLDLLTNEDDTVAAKLLSYNRANRAVAVLCNHQRAVPKNFDKQMENLQAKIDAKNEAIADCKREVKAAKSDYKNSHSEKNKSAYERKKKQLERLEEQLNKLEVQQTDKDENKEIALGTSKLNYLDPRISVAWCKKHEVPIEKIYNKTQRDKFRWAIDMAGPEYVF